MRRGPRAATVALCVAACFLASVAAAELPERPHVLVMIVDDLRQLRHAPGQPAAHTPNLDRLAAEGIDFSHAFAPVPVCGASRASFLTGLAPTHERFRAYNARADEEAPEAVTLPGFFAEHGYVTRGYGKVFHDRDDSIEDWTAGHHAPNAPATRWRQYATEEAIAASERVGRKGPPVEEGRHPDGTSLPDAAYHDGRTADELIGDLIADGRHPDRPVLYVAGFVKPHLPFVAPGRYWDRYDPERFERDRPLDRGEGVPDAAIHDSHELLRFSGIPGPPPYDDALQDRLLHGYLAATSFADAQVGRVLDALEASGLADRTVVVLLSDHGYLLGEQACGPSTRSSSRRCACRWSSASPAAPPAPTPRWSR